MNPFEAQAYIMGNIKKTEEINIPLSEAVGFYTSRPIVASDGSIVLEKGEKIDSRRLIFARMFNIQEVSVHRKPVVRIDLEDDHIRKLLMLIVVEEGFKLGYGNVDFIITSNRPQRVEFLVSKVEQRPASNLAFFIDSRKTSGFYISGSISDIIVATYVFILPALRSAFGSANPYQKKMYLQSANSYQRTLGGKSLFLPARITDDSLVEILNPDEENYLLCDALIHITPDMFGIHEEQEIEVYLL